MTFLLDENISPELRDYFSEAGLTSIHVNQLKKHKRQRIVDDQIRHLAIFSSYIIVTRDDDFVKSYVDRKVPERMIFVYRLDNKSDLLQAFHALIPRLQSIMEAHDFLEVRPEGCRFPF